LDRIAEEGFVFEYAVPQASWTRASMAAMVTGLFPQSLNIEEPSDEPNVRQLHGDFTTMAEVFAAAGYTTIGVTANPNTNAVFNYDQGYDHYADSEFYWRPGKGEHKLTAAQINERFLSFLKEADDEKPFFGHLVYVDVHWPRISKKAVDGDDAFTLPSPMGPMDEYDLQISYVDEQIAALRAELGRMGRADTLLVINSDHGEGFGQGRPYDTDHGLWLYNSTTHVPWIVHHPALPKGGRYAGLVQVIDMMPTVLDLVRIAFDGGKVAGQTRAMWVRANSAAWVGSMDSGFTVTGTQFLSADRTAYLTEEYKLIVDNKAATKDSEALSAYEVYRYREDRLEAENLAGKDAELFGELRGKLAIFRETHPPLVSDEGLKVDVSEKTGRDLRNIGYVGP
jgi:arylsulfatase A-like enzyme